MTRFLLRLSVLVAVGCSATPSTPPGDPKTASTPLKPDMTVSAVDLAKEFETDKAAADKKYTGKVLQVEGEVREVLAPSGGRTPLLLAGTPASADKGPGHSIQALFDDKAAAKVSGLTPGQKVTVMGKYQGDNGIFVSLSDCTLGDVGPDPTIAVKAADLTRAFVTDKKAADAKYKDKWLLVEGVVVETRDPSDKHFVTVFLEGHDEKAASPVRVEAILADDKKDAVKGLKKGDTVKVKGECAGLVAGNVVLNRARPIK